MFENYNKGKKLKNLISIYSLFQIKNRNIQEKNIWYYLHLFILALLIIVGISCKPDYNKSLSEAKSLVNNQEYIKAYKKIRKIPPSFENNQGVILLIKKIREEAPNYYINIYKDLINQKKEKEAFSIIEDLREIIHPDKNPFLETEYARLIKYSSNSNNSNNVSSKKPNLFSNLNCSNINSSLTSETNQKKKQLFSEHKMQVFFKPVANVDFETLKEEELGVVECIFTLLEPESAINEQKQLLELYIKAGKYDRAYDFIAFYELTDYAINLYSDSAKKALEKYSKNSVSDRQYELSKSYRNEIMKLNPSSDKIQKIDTLIEYYRPAGTNSEAYNLCKDSVSANLKFPDSAEFEYGTLSLMAAGALMGSPCDVVNEKVCIKKIRSWVKSQNQVGLLGKTNFYCEVTYDKKTNEGKVSKLSL